MAYLTPEFVREQIERSAEDNQVIDRLIANRDKSFILWIAIQNASNERLNPETSLTLVKLIQKANADIVRVIDEQDADNHFFVHIKKRQERWYKQYPELVALRQQDERMTKFVEEQYIQGQISPLGPWD